MDLFEVGCVVLDKSYANACKNIILLRSFFPCLFPDVLPNSPFPGGLILAKTRPRDENRVFLRFRGFFI